MLLTTILFATGALAGAMNALAGGGSFVSFPVLVAIGLPPVVANASSTVALFPGGLGSIWAYRSDLRPVFVGVPLWALGLASAAGGAIGAVLLLSTPQALFDAVVPWILLLATLTFAFGRRLGERLGTRLLAGPAALLALQLVLGLYGGYFGGAVGIMMMAAWMVTTRADVRTMTPHRSLLVNAANAIAVVLFVADRTIAPAATLAMLAGAVAGGYLGARFTRRLDARIIRDCVVGLGTVVTAAFFVRAFL